VSRATREFMKAREKANAAIDMAHNFAEINKTIEKCAKSKYAQRMKCNDRTTLDYLDNV